MESMLKYIITLVVTLFTPLASAASIEEVVIPSQDVMIWNNVELSTLEVVKNDLNLWCNKTHTNHCTGFGLSTYLSADRSIIYYEFGLSGVDDILAIYSVSSTEKNSILGKSWVSTWKYPFINIKPFVKAVR